MTAPFPHHYQVELRQDGGRAVVLAGERPAIVGGAPAEFDGRDDWWSPEALLLASVSLCIETTYEALARKRQLSVGAWSSRALGTLDKTPTGLAFVAIRVEVEVTVAGPDVERAQALLDGVGKYCLISNSLKPTVEIVGRARAAAAA